MSSNSTDTRLEQFKVLVKKLVDSLGCAGFDLLQQFHHIVWFGSLNYRITSLTAGAVSQRMALGSLMEQWKADPLNDELKKGKTCAFKNFKEPRPRLDFYPTYMKTLGRQLDFDQIQKQGNDLILMYSWTTSPQMAQLRWINIIYSVLLHCIMIYENALAIFDIDKGMIQSPLSNFFSFMKMQQWCLIKMKERLFMILHQMYCILAFVLMIWFFILHIKIESRFDMHCKLVFYIYTGMYAL